MFDFFDAVIIGLVEGITEFLPISSTGHMILASHLLGLTGNPVVESFEVVIQLGAILAVVFLYAGRFQKLFDFGPTEGFAGLRGWKLLAITSAPILGLGFVFNHAIKDLLFNPTTVAIALGIGGVVLIWAERRKHAVDIDSLDTLTPKKALMIGLFQALALCPGVSRAGATIIGGLFNGLDRKVAAEYSFLVAVPIMGIVCTKDMIEVLPSLTANDLSLFGTGFVVAFISAFFAVKSFVQFLERSTMTAFGVYRIIAAAAVFGLMR